MRLFGYIKICTIINQQSQSKQCAYTYNICKYLKCCNTIVCFSWLFSADCSFRQSEDDSQLQPHAPKLRPADGECPSAVLCCRTWRHPLATSRQRCPAGWCWNTSRLRPRPRHTTGSAGRRPASHSTCSSWTVTSNVRGLVPCPYRPSDEPWSKRTARAASHPASSLTPCCRPRTRVNGRPPNRPPPKG